MEIKYVDITDLTPYENNPRINEAAVEAVANSIEEFGFRNPILIDADGVIIAGHTRLAAAKALGLQTVPVIVAEGLTEEQIKAFRLVDNKTAELSKWDFELLESELNELSLDMEKFGFIEDKFDESLLDDLFTEAQESKEKEPKQIQCPHCGEWFTE